jgi:hypothetical protein
LKLYASIALLVSFRVRAQCINAFQFPRFFSAGFVTHEGPNREEMDKVKFTITLVGEGWEERLSEPTDQHTEPPNKKKVVKVGQDPYLKTVFYPLSSL